MENSLESSSEKVMLEAMLRIEGVLYLLLPVPKVPLGALGHPVTILFRARVGVRGNCGVRAGIESRLPTPV